MTRFRQDGNDRLYAKTFDGTEVGFIDLLSGYVEVYSPEFDDELRALAPTRDSIPSAKDTPATTVPPRRNGLSASIFRRKSHRLGFRHQ